jgi:hypothetical protein
MFSFCSASIIRASQTIDKEEIVHKLIEAKKLQSKITIFSFFKKITVLKKELELESKLSGKKTETIKLKAKDRCSSQTFFKKKIYIHYINDFIGCQNIFRLLQFT